MCMNPLHFFQSKFLHDEEKIIKSVSKPTFKNITRFDDNAFDDKRFYVNNIKSYPYDENQYLFKKDLVNKIRRTSLDLDKDLLINNI